jgi:hypothetical protein
LVVHEIDAIRLVVEGDRRLAACEVNLDPERHLR